VHGLRDEGLESFCSTTPSTTRRRQAWRSFSICSRRQSGSAQADGQADRQTGRQTDRQTARLKQDQKKMEKGRQHVQTYEQNKAKQTERKGKQSKAKQSANERMAKRILLSTEIT